MNKNKHTLLQASRFTKSLSLFLVTVMLLSTVPMIAGANDNDDQRTIVHTYSISEVGFKESKIGGNFVNLIIDGVEGKSNDPRMPMLPVLRDSEWLPLGSNVQSVTLHYDTTIEVTLPDETIATPSPIPVPLIPPESPFDLPDFGEIDESVYTAHQPYGEYFTYSTAIGKQPNGDLGVLVSYEITPVIFTDLADGKATQMVGDIQVEITYDEYQSTALAGEETYDLLILTPNAYVNDLQPLVMHKEEMGLKTKLVTLDEIYDETYFDLPDMVPNANREFEDEQEMIKFFIYKAVLPNGWNIDYVMAVGGWRTFLGFNRPDQQFPVRFIPETGTPMDPADEPGYISDQYYACCVAKGDNGIPTFDIWGVAPSDLISDVYFGRIACRNSKEVRTCVDKIIHYETNTYGSDWFNRFLTITGDGFQDMGFRTNLGVEWDITDLADGEYTIYAQSHLYDDDSVKGPIDEVHVTLDRTAESRVSFAEDDHQKIEPLTDNQDALYPAQPVAEIVVPADEDILGNTEVVYSPDEAYIGENWAGVNYNPTTGILFIRSKSYDPTPKYDPNHILIDPANNPYYDLASRSYITIWVENSDEEVVLDPVVKESRLYYEGELECEKAHDYIPDTYEETRLWTSNGLWTGMQDVIDEFSTGYGLVYFAGHGNPMSWGDHLPAIPGGRDDGMINGLKNINLDFGLARYESEEGDPLFPMDKLTNGYKQAVTLIGGCHNSMIDCSLSKLLIEPNDVLFTVLHGAWVPECYDWWLARMPQGGAMTTIGCSGLGYGYLAENSVEGLGGWINPEFFRIFVEYADDGVDTVGAVYTHTLINFTRGEAPLGGHAKTTKEWVLLGDPTLKIGGYDMDSLEFGDDDEDDIEIGELIVEGGSLTTSLTNNMGEEIYYVDWELRVDSAAPLARYFGVSGTFLETIFRGRIFSGGFGKGEIARFKEDETIEISAPSVFGFGHIEVNCSVFYEDELVQYEIEDGFLLGGRLYVFHPEE